MKGLVDGIVRRVTTSTVLLLQALGLATGGFAWLLGWEVAVTGLALIHLVVILVGPRPDGAHQGAVAELLTSVERRLDALSARVVAGAERTRVDVWDALVGSRDDTGNRWP